MEKQPLLRHKEVMFKSECGPGPCVSHRTAARLAAAYRGHGLTNRGGAVTAEEGSNQQADKAVTCAWHLRVTGLCRKQSGNAPMSVSSTQDIVTKWRSGFADWKTVGHNLPKAETL